jgi:hypothetical protein
MIGGPRWTRTANCAILWRGVSVLDSAFLTRGSKALRTVGWPTERLRRQWRARQQAQGGLMIVMRVEWRDQLQTGLVT